MIEIEIPGEGKICLKNVVFDFNGTLAEDGFLCEGVAARIRELAARGVKIFLLTSDTYGSAAQQWQGLPGEVKIFPGDGAAQEKRKIVEELGRECTATVGNGRNDVEMFKVSRLAIAVVGREGCFSGALTAADIVVTSIVDALDILLKPERIKATLRT